MPELQITITGAPKSGKSRLARLIRYALERHGVVVMKLHDPDHRNDFYNYGVSYDHDRGMIIDDPVLSKLQVEIDFAQTPKG